MSNLRQDCGKVSICVRKKCDYTIRYNSHSLGTVEALVTVDRGQTLRTHFPLTILTLTCEKICSTTTPKYYTLPTIIKNKPLNCVLTGWVYNKLATSVFTRLMAYLYNLT